MQDQRNAGKSYFSSWLIDDLSFHYLFLLEKFKISLLTHTELPPTVLPSPAVHFVPAKEPATKGN
ncbi:hypothetical protein SLEP1_g32690 [Rubroshorea leprosula]|uniref:Uncharacterized protein n=1 Tax=Rubroshorea leprosula TaxID=152421 RepID=A0AAV5KE96_9ROSI|nr:hypothetical protein SLEP1_g32690 [Rubroshorea leprosula]